MPDCQNGAFAGKTVAVQISLQCSDTPPGSYDDVGATRALNFAASRGNQEVTTRDSAGFREYIQDYIDGTLSFDGTLLRDATATSKAIREYFLDGTVATAHAWIKLTYPESGNDTTTIEIPVVLTNYENNLDYEPVATFSVEANFNGQPIFTDVPGA